MFKTLCLLVTWRMNEVHFARMRASKPSLVEVAHQFRDMVELS